jgi:hypothetical protein
VSKIVSVKFHKAEDQAAAPAMTSTAEPKEGEPAMA